MNRVSTIPFLLFSALVVVVLLAPVSVRAQIYFPDFPTTTGLQLVGATARAPGNVLRLTPSSSNQVGAAWYAEPQYVRSGFIATFSFRMLAPGGQSDGASNGGDGLAFVIQNQSDTAIGYAGGSIGYEGITKSLAIEFDTWDDGFSRTGDPNGNHIAINTRGSFPNSADHGWTVGPVAASEPTFGDGTTHNVVVEYWNRTMSVYMDGCTRPVLRVGVNLDSLLALTDGRAWMGFTAATQSAWETHDILSWQSTSFGIAYPDTVVTMCKGDSLVLTVPTLNGEVEWPNNYRAKSLTVRTSGLYTAIVRERLGCNAPTMAWSVRVNVVDLDDPVITADGSLEFCLGDSVTLDAGVDAQDYRWSHGPTSRKVTVYQEGNYTVTVGAPGCTKESKPVRVRLLPPPVPVITALTPTSVCVGDSVDLLASAGYVNYRWSNGAVGQRVRVGDSANYSVTVTDANGCIGTSQALLVRVVRTPQPSIVPSGPTHFCEGDTVVLEASPGYFRYQWSTGDTGQALVVRRSGTYSVTVFTPEGCFGNAPTITVKVNTPPDPVVAVEGPTSFCSGDSVTLRAPAGFAEYAWSDGTTADSLRVGAAGSYAVTVTDSIGCTGISPPVAITISETVTVAITPEGPTEFCLGDSVTLGVPAVFKSYLWSNGATTSSITVGGTGSFTVDVETAGGCAGRSNTVAVTVHPLPAAPVITQAGTVLQSTPAAAWQWSFQGTPIPGATASTHTPVQDGDYTVAITDNNGCTAVSAPFAYAAQPEAVVSVMLGSAAAEPGERVTVPILLDASSGLDDGRGRTFTAQIRFNSSLLMPVGTTPVGTVQDGERVIEIRGQRPAGMVTGTLAQLEFIAMLGDSVATPLVLDSFTWDEGPVTVSTGDGLFQLNALCTEGGTRLLGAGGAGLKVIAPNPSSDQVRIQYTLAERGIGRLEIVDALGRHIAMLQDGIVSPGQFTALFDARSVPAGRYFCVLRTPTQVFVEMVVVKK